MRSSFSVECDSNKAVTSIAASHQLFKYSYSPIINVVLKKLEWNNSSCVSNIFSYWNLSLLSGGGYCTSTYKHIWLRYIMSNIGLSTIPITYSLCFLSLKANSCWKRSDKPDCFMFGQRWTLHRNIDLSFCRNPLAIILASDSLAQKL